MMSNQFRERTVKYTPINPVWTTLPARAAGRPGKIPLDCMCPLTTTATGTRWREPGPCSLCGMSCSIVCEQHKVVRQLATTDQLT